MKVGKFYNLKDCNMKIQVLEKIFPNENNTANSSDTKKQVFLNTIQGIVNKVGYGIYPCALLGANNENGLLSGDIIFFDDGGKMLKTSDIQKKLFDIDFLSEQEEIIFKIQPIIEG